MYLIYSMPGCPSCLKAKNLLTIKGLSFQEKVIDDPQERLEFLTKLKGWRSFPVIFEINSDKPSQFIGGYEALAGMLP